LGFHQAFNSPRIASIPLSLFQDLKANFRQSAVTIRYLRNQANLLATRKLTIERLPWIKKTGPDILLQNPLKEINKLDPAPNSTPLIPNAVTLFKSRVIGQ